jgi:hypothetical protein
VSIVFFHLIFLFGRGGGERRLKRSPYVVCGSFHVKGKLEIVLHRNSLFSTSDAAPM